MSTTTSASTQAKWPPPCEYGRCGQESTPGLVEVDFGSGGKRPLRLCAEHRTRLAEGPAPR